jgi:hypothetical protein
MKDSFFLITAAVVASGLAWVFWHFMGNDGFEVISAIALVALTADNIRLRRQLRARQSS